VRAQRYVLSSGCGHNGVSIYGKTESGQQYMIHRIWNATARAERRDDYIQHLKDETFQKLRALDGFVEAYVLRGTALEYGGVPVQVVTVWQSVEAIKSFAGEDATVAVVPAVAQKMMLQFDERATHLEVVAKVAS
jgi:heme-degrading monooxygenase HmoA